MRSVFCIICVESVFLRVDCSFRLPDTCILPASFCLPVWVPQHDLCEDLVPMKATGAEQLAKRAETQKKKIAELEQVCAQDERIDSDEGKNWFG